MASTQLYKGKIRLAGNIVNEVPKTGMSAAEIIVLRREHGDDAVVDITPTEKVSRSNEAERERLDRIYGDTKMLELFGEPFRDLPTRVPGMSILPRKGSKAAPENQDLDSILAAE
ncbi:MAG TPA: hypothetical protein VKA19_05350 [Alphaproteobacteria bacterium]|nr:hypothetical protein [Alphaproteobacteria bacterium]